MYQRSYKSGKDRQPGDRRRKSDPDPVHDKYKNRRCGGNGSSRSRRLTAAGCDIIRCAVPTKEAAECIERDQKADLRFRW